MSKYLISIFQYLAKRKQHHKQNWGGRNPTCEETCSSDSFSSSNTSCPCCTKSECAKD